MRTHCKEIRENGLPVRQRTLTHRHWMSGSGVSLARQANDSAALRRTNMRADRKVRLLLEAAHPDQRIRNGRGRPAHAESTPPSRSKRRRRWLTLLCALGRTCAPIRWLAHGTLLLAGSLDRLLLEASRVAFAFLPRARDDGTEDKVVKFRSLAQLLCTNTL
jgi:hypothetical protein